MEVCDDIVVLRDGEVVLTTEPSKTTVREIASSMVGRNIEKAAQGDAEERKFGREILKVRNLWVDMPGETVRDVNLDIKEGEIFGIGGLAGQGKLGISNGIMGLYASGGAVEFDSKAVQLNDPTSPLSMGISSVSEDRRGVGLLLDESIAWNIIFTSLQNQKRFLKPSCGGLVKVRDDNAILNAPESTFRSWRSSASARNSVCASSPAEISRRSAWPKLSRRIPDCFSFRNRRAASTSARKKSCSIR